MWDLIILVPDHCLSFYFEIGVGGVGVDISALIFIFSFLSSSLWRTAVFKDNIK